MMMRSNPFYHLIEIVRAPVLGEPISHATWLYVAVMTLVGWSIAIVAYRRYARFVPIWL
jgi:ABC-type polysaccharide/polyol phosphate export permease